jgi:hypothetical protein
VISKKAWINAVPRLKDAHSKAQGKRSAALGEWTLNRRGL